MKYKSILTMNQQSIHCNLGEHWLLFSQLHPNATGQTAIWFVRAYLVPVKPNGVSNFQQLWRKSFNEVTSRQNWDSRQKLVIYWMLCNLLLNSANFPQVCAVNLAVFTSSQHTAPFYGNIIMSAPLSVC